MTNKKTVPVFFATDDNYIPYLAVCLQSIKENRSRNYKYEIYILNTGVNGADAEKIERLAENDFNISFVDVSEKLGELSDKLQLRDYYTHTTYYRLFIARMFPEYEKALYLDCDVVVTGDVSELYFTDIGENLVGAIPDQSVNFYEPFMLYVNEVLGVTPEKYFNAGILLMNLKKFREVDFYSQFSDLLQRYKFIVAQDQDYLNVICKDKVHYIGREWNTMPIASNACKNPKLVHYNLTRKPWHHNDVLFQEFFWEYAKKTEYYDFICKVLEDYTAEEIKADAECEKGLIELCFKEAAREDNYYKKYVLNA